ncbi:hypothetical protein TNIN_499881 [Trichonephila inaurata madagascariensis]|uniref:Uncharacterized protein n=1 Tax=Trichonephila inaurata madagascariensis TaxID=2747483 RepID=A0A8X7CN18_9ARAC|nr:hypothetical protein TNIN_499881 [Trichonephila inaurata madagascariensis]
MRCSTLEMLILLKSLEDIMSCNIFIIGTNIINFQPGEYQHFKPDGVTLYGISAFLPDNGLGTVLESAGSHIKRMSGPQRVLDRVFVELF